jgi:sulfoxide reductase heme-binding subunit YedZ
MTSFGSRSRVLLESRFLFWGLLALPGIYYLQGYVRETLFYGEVVHASGVLAVRILLVTLALTPLGLLWPRAAWVRWLKRRRRYFGVAAFGYALLHALVYVERQPSWDRIIDDARASAMWTGWVALAVMLVLAATSNDRSVRQLGARWRRLHRTVYIAAALSFAHWILSAFNPDPGYYHLFVLAVLLALRMLLPSLRRRFSGAARS